MNKDITPQRVLWLILGLGFGLRLIYLYQAVDTPLFEVLLIDSEFYDRRAREIAAGNWWGERPFFMNPFYGYFLAIQYVIWGAKYWAVGLVQAVMGIGSCALIYGLGRQVWNEKIGLVAAGLAAVYGPYLFYDGALLTATPITFLNLAALFCMVRSCERNTLWLWAAGLLFGLSVTARPMVLLFVVAAGAWYAAQWGQRGIRRWVKIMGGCALVVGLVVWRNYMVGGEWLLTTSSAGMNFYVGNHEGANGIYSQVGFLNSAEPELERTAFIREAEIQTGESLSPGQVSRFWLAQGLRFITDQPLAYLQLIGRKLYMFCNGVEAQNNLSIYLARDFVPLLRWCVIGWGVLTPFAVGNWLLDKRGRCSLLDLYLITYLAGCLLFFVSSEYRLPVVPILCLYAARWILAARDMFARRHYRPLIKSSLLVAVVALPINYRDLAAEQLTLKRVDYYNFATLYQRKGDWLRAEELYRQALQIDPLFFPARSGLDKILVQQGKAHNSGAMAADPQVQQGLEMFSSGNYTSAIIAFEQALDSGMREPQVYNNLGLCYYRLGELHAAADYFAQALNVDSLYVRARYNLALVHLGLGDDHDADKALARVIEIDPNYNKAYFQRGALLWRLGHLAAAESHWAFLLAKMPGDLRLKAKIDSTKAVEKL